MAQRAGRIGVLVFMLAIAGCVERPVGNLIEVSARDPNASVVSMLVTTTRAPVDDAGVMYGGERARGLGYADISVSIPPDSARKIGEIQWPKLPPGDPSHDFVTVNAEVADLDRTRVKFDARLDKSGSRHALVYVHGYNSRFEEAVYRFAQIVHDSGANVVPVLFTWASRGKALSYMYDRESATYSRDALEAVLQGIVDDKHVTSISVLAHSLGNFVAIEALRQMAIRNRGLSPKFKDIMLASPDVDVDVFRRQIAEIEKDKKAPPITLFVSQDDKALSMSKSFAGDEPRLGAIDPTVEPYRDILAQTNVHVVDLTSDSADDEMAHGKFATSAVVRSIGVRLASGQKLNDAKPTLDETVRGMAVSAATEAAGVTTGPAPAPAPSPQP